MNPFVADPEWGIWIILYFYLGGIAAGAYFLATLVGLFGHDDDQVISRIGYRLALPLILVCGVLLVIDLERPERFWHMMFQSEVVDSALEQGWPSAGWGTMAYAINLKYWSPMSIGAWALALFGFCGTLSFVGTLLAEGWLNRLLAHGIVGRILQIVGSAVGFFVGSYTGVLLSASNQPLWSLSDWIGPLFLASSASTGIASVLLLAKVGNAGSPATLERLERADLWALGLELFIFLIFLASLGDLLPLVIETKPGRILVAATLIAGLIIPLALHIRPAPSLHWPMVVAAVFSLVGGFGLRYGVLETAPALLDEWTDLTSGEPLTAVWRTPAGISLLAVTALLGIAIPIILQRRWSLGPGQVVAAACVSLLVCAMVAVLAFRVQTGTPMLEQARLPGFSPEDGRPRGGGVGASELNRPHHVRLRSKIVGTLPHEP